MAKKVATWRFKSVSMDNIRINYIETGINSKNLIKSALDTDYRKAFLNSLNLRVQ